MAYADLLSVILDDAFSEIYVIDCETLRLVEVNRTARRNLQHADATLAAMRLPELALAQQDAAANYRALLDSLDNDDIAEARLDTTHVRADGSTYPIELRLHRCGGNDAPALYVAIGRDGLPLGQVEGPFCLVDLNEKGARLSIRKLRTLRISFSF